MKIINKTYDEFKNHNKFNEIELPSIIIIGKPKPEKNKKYDIDRILATQNNDGTGFCIATILNNIENFAVRYNWKKDEGFPVLKDAPKQGAWLAIPKNVLKELAQELINLL